MASAIMLDTDILLRVMAALEALLRARELPPAQLGAIVACCQDNGAPDLAALLIGPLPFDEDADRF